MKKYVKPDLIYETYELSYNVANCSAALNHMEQETYCNIHDFEGIELGYTVFTVNVNCTAGEDQYPEEYCKFTGSATHVMFTS